MEFNPQVFRTLVFVRHGQYVSDPEKLTAVGRKQARLTARALASLQPKKIYCSTMPRAIETAQIIAHHHKLEPENSDLFREGLLPGTVEFKNFITRDLLPQQKIEKLAQVQNARKAANLAFKKLFKRPKQGQSLEVIIAHGNVIRFWVCKALDIPEDRWLKMDVSHASITTIRISKKGNIVLLGFADKGHLPIALRTYV